MSFTASSRVIFFARQSTSAFQKLVRPTAKPMNPGTPEAVASHSCTFLSSPPPPKRDAPASAAAMPARHFDNCFAILPAIQALDLPDVRLNASVLQLLD